MIKNLFPISPLYPLCSIVRKGLWRYPSDLLVYRRKFRQKRRRPHQGSTLCPVLLTALSLHHAVPLAAAHYCHCSNISVSVLVKINRKFDRKPIFPKPIAAAMQLLTAVGSTLGPKFGRTALELRRCPVGVCLAGTRAPLHLGGQHRVWGSQTVTGPWFGTKIGFGGRN